MSSSPLSLKRRSLLIGCGALVLMSDRALAAPAAPRRLSLRNEHTGETFDGPYRDADGPLPDAMADLAKSYGDDWSSWRWGDAHRVTFESPLWRNVPLVNRLLRGTLPDDGDGMTVDCATALPALDGDYPVVHGPSMRFSIDMAHPLAPIFSLAGGQSGRSRHCCAPVT